MARRNAQAVAARARKAGAHKDIPQMTCDGCGCNMGYKPPSPVCSTCEFEAKREAAPIRDLCPVCKMTPLTGCGPWTADLGEVCGMRCLEAKNA